jgi:hypothetical protein
MKKLAALLFTLVSGTAFAVEANVLRCQGQDIVINMTTSSWTGRPTLSLGRTEVDSSVALTQVELTNTSMGNVVTGFFPHIADASLTYTLIVPDVKITDKDVSGIQGMALLRRRVAAAAAGVAWRPPQRGGAWRARQAPHCRR